MSVKTLSVIVRRSVKFIDAFEQKLLKNHSLVVKLNVDNGGRWLCIAGLGRESLSGSLRGHKSDLLQDIQERKTHKGDYSVK